MTRVRFARFVFVAWLIAPIDAHAQARDPGAAEALFDAGQAAMSAGDYTEACAKFEESQRLDPGAGTLLNIGACSEKLGRVVVAWQSYTEAKRTLAQDDRRMPYAEERVKALTARVPWLTIRLAPGTPGDASVVRNDVALGPSSLNVPLPTDPGRVKLIVRARGRKDRETEITLAEGEKREVTLETGERLAKPVAETPRAPPPRPEPPRSSRPRSPPTEGPDRTLGFVVGGVGVAGLALSGVATVLMLNKQSDVKADCDTDTKICDSQAGADAAKAGKTWSTVSTVAFVVGAAGVGVGTYLILTAEPRPARSARLPAPLLSIGGRF